MKTLSGIRKAIDGGIWGAALALGVLLGTLLFVTGCDEECDLPVVGEYAPAAPTGVYSITDIFWSDRASEGFEYMVSVARNATSYVDYDVENGYTYYYKIRAFDLVDRVSGFSAVMFDTPRPAGTGLILYDYLGQKAGLSGYDFSEYLVQPSGADTTDVYFGSPGGLPTLFGKGTAVGEGVDVQDYGFVDLELVDWAPEIYEGWAPTKRVHLIQGHSYVVQIRDHASIYYFYAKVYCQAVTNDFVVLDWAFQADPGNPELAPERGGQR
jgi:hypothetical protein